MSEIFAIHIDGKLATRDAWCELNRSQYHTQRSATAKFYRLKQSAKAAITMLPEEQRHRCTIVRYVPEG